MNLPKINAIWIGSKLGPLHAACLASFVRTGHSVTLHCYETVVDAPGGVVLADANRLIPAAEIEPYRMAKALAVASDLMRYEVLRLGLGLYVDVDVYCYRPMEDSDFIFGWEDRTQIANGVLKLPVESEALKVLLSIRRGRDYTAAWVGRRRQVQRLVRSLLRPACVDLEPWGWTGPAATTWALKKSGEANHAAPPDVFYPLDFRRESSFFDPGLSLEDITTSRTRYIHVYHKHRKDAVGIHPASPAGRMIAAS